MRVCEKVGIDKKESPLYVIAFMASDSIEADVKGEQYNLKIVQHGIEPEGD